METGKAVYTFSLIDNNYFGLIKVLLFRSVSQSKICGVIYISSCKFVRWVILLWSLAGILCAIASPLYYLTWPGFIEQGETTFASVSWLMFHGNPLYTDLASAELYSLQHGPIIYLIVGSVMKILGPGYITAKLATVGAFLLVIAFSWRWFVKQVGMEKAIYLLGLQSWIFLHWPYTYLVRPDGIMLLCVLASMIIVTTWRSRTLLILGTAIPLGVIVNLKVHGLFYFLPILALAYQRIGLQSMFLVGCISALIGIAPFLSPEISLTNYFLWLVQSVHHGLKWQSFLAKISLGLGLFLIPVAIGIIFGISLGDFYRKNRSLIIVLLISAVVPAVIGSKAGSGTNHFIPFIPVFMVIMLLLAHDIDKRCGHLPEVIRTRFAVNLSWTILFVIVFIITVSGTNGLKRAVKHSFYDRTSIMREFASIEAEYAGKPLEIGYGEKESYFYRDLMPIPVFHGNPYLVDLVALGDMKGAGLSIPDATIQKLDRGAVDVWLIPAGQRPFAMKRFDEPFRQAFFRNYTLAGSTKYFDIWIYRKTEQ